MCLSFCGSRLLFGEWVRWVEVLGWFGGDGGDGVGLG